MRNKHLVLGCTLAALVIAAAPAGQEARAEPIRVTVTNTAPAGSFFFTPVWLSLHDGTFDSHNLGEPLEPNFPFTEPLAELGVTGPITAAFAAAANPRGLQTTLVSPSGPPPFGPGQSASFVFNVTDRSAQRFLSYASMLVPSNDLFFANDNPRAHAVFDASGNFTGPFTIDVFGIEIKDGGSEANEPLNGAAFVVGVDPMRGIETSFPVAIFLNQAGASEDLSELVGLTTPGGTITTPFGPGTRIATINVAAVPEPSTALMLSIGGLALLAAPIRRALRRIA